MEFGYQLLTHVMTFGGTVYWNNSDDCAIGTTHIAQANPFVMPFDITWSFVRLRMYLSHPEDDLHWAWCTLDTCQEMIRT
eukprot:1305895-Amphidinium_carterae.1